MVGGFGASHVKTLFPNKLFATVELEALSTELVPCTLYLNHIKNNITTLQHCYIYFTYHSQTSPFLFQRIVIIHNRASHPHSTHPNMTKQPPKLPSTKPHKKLPRLPPNTSIQKRPLLHPPIASKLTASKHSRKEIYIGASTQFMPTIKRVRSYLSSIRKRSDQTPRPTHPSAATLNTPGGLLGMDDAALLKALDEEKKGDEEVVVKGTGRAIERVLEIGLFLMGEDDLRVQLRTGSVGAVDDLVVEDGEDATRVRRVSYVEVAVRLR